MFRRRAALTCAIWLLAVLATARSLPAAETPPNLIVILADDLGYGDLGCYGQKRIQTPTLDKMAHSGIRFTDFYAGSTVCAPSRCTLLTGRHTGRVAVRGNVEVLMDEQTTTIAEMLKSAGYATGAIGKWGVGHPPPPGNPKTHGFDEFYGYLDMWHAHNYFPDFLWRNGKKSAIQGNIVKVVRRGGVALQRARYSHDLFIAEAQAFLRRHASDPFFLYLPFTIPHANNEAGTEGMEVPSDAPYTAEDWPQAQKNHAAMITRLDRSLRDILDLLDKLELAERTVVMFTSDNGPHAEGGADPAFFNSAGGLRGYKRSLHEGGIRVPLIVRWPGTIKPERTTDHVAAFWDILPTAADLAGVNPPASIDGISFLPTLLGEKDRQKQHEYLYWEFHERGSDQAVRMGDWKAVRPVGGSMELFDLKTDLHETTDVAAKHPDVVEKIDAIMKAAHTDSPLFPLKPKPQPK
jgi:arylsulfatase A-like enzyme